MMKNLKSPKYFKKQLKDDDDEKDSTKENINLSNSRMTIMRKKP